VAAIGYIDLTTASNSLRFVGLCIQGDRAARAVEPKKNPACAGSNRLLCGRASSTFYSSGVVSEHYRSATHAFLLFVVSGADVRSLFTM